MENSIATYFMMKCYMNGNRISGGACTKEEALIAVQELITKAGTEVNTGDAAEECRKCKYASLVPGSSHHLQCSDPDPFMKGDEHGIKNGWFIYPFNFDPIWKTHKCINYYNEEDERQTDESKEN